MSQVQLRDVDQAASKTIAHSPTVLIYNIQANLRSLQSDGVDAVPQQAVQTLGEWRVVLTVLTVLGMTEIAFVAGKQRLSKDVEHLQSFPQLAERFATTVGTGPKVL